MDLEDADAAVRCLISDRDATFPDVFDRILAGNGIHNRHRPHHAMDQAAPLRPVPQPATDPGETARLDGGSLGAVAAT
jgi:hypothetical protein